MLYSGHMRPSLAPDNFSDGAIIDAEIGCHFKGRLAILRSLPDGADIVILQNRIVMIFTLLTSMFSHIFEVFGARTPAQIFKFVVTRVSIQVATFVAWGLRLHKSTQNKVMHIEQRPSTQTNDVPAVLVIGRCFKEFPRLVMAPAVVAAGPNSSVRTGSVSQMVRDVLIYGHMSIQPLRDRGVKCFI